MKKDNNKGFTLIEIIIAVAVLSLLLTPIVQQFTQTMATNRRAKEQQYANSEATRLLEKYQSLDKKEITAYLSDINKTTEVSCELVYREGDELKTVEPAGFKYLVAKVNEPSGKAGNSRAEYDKEIIIDDMSTKLLSYSDGYNLIYGLTDSDLDFYNEKTAGGYELTNEGTIVKYNDDGYVVSAVVERYINNEYTNPNETNVIALNNLNADTSAMILDSASSPDKQANSDFNAQIIDAAYSKKDTNAQAALDYAQITAGSDLLSQLDLNVSKKTYVTVSAYIKSGDSVVKPEYVMPGDVIDHYQIDVTVKYSFGLDPNRTVFKYIDSSDLEELSYDVYSKVFVTPGATKVPAVYIEYQPYSNDAKDAYYVKEDYVELDSNVENAKIYMIKPTKDKDYLAVSETDRDYFMYEYDAAEGKRTKIKVTTTAGTKKYTSGSVEVDTRPVIVTNISKTCYEYVSGVEADKFLKSVGDDTESAARLYTLTVNLEPTGSNKDKYNDTSISGAWGDK